MSPPTADETAPLLPLNNDAEALASRDAEHGRPTNGLLYMTLLTLGFGGLQIAWSVELSHGSPYLLSLGVSKSLMALVWIAGPLTGSIVVPYVGILSDNCRLPWGRRRPYLVGGTLGTVASLLLLAWAREIVGGISSLFGRTDASEGGGGGDVVVVVVAVVGIYLVDIAINTVQAALRAFVVDCAPPGRQELANSMAGRLTGVGNIIGYVAGYSDLPSRLPFLGRTQFQILCAIACLALSVTITLSVFFIREETGEGRPPVKTPGIGPFFFNLMRRSVRRLPPQTKRVCRVQFCAWIGFFPLLFYSSSYIAEIYVQPFLRARPDMTREEVEVLYQQATRIGTFALLINAIVSLSTNVFLPFFITPSLDDERKEEAEQGAFLFSSARWLRIPGLTVKRAWIGSLVLFALAMFCCPFVSSVEAATALIGVAGITWAMALWAPWAIIGAEINRRDGKRQSSPRQEDDEGEADEALGEEEEEEGDEAGVVLGIHNMAIAVPQIVATVGSSIIFKLWQKPRGTPGDGSIGVVMALGGACVLLSVLFAAGIDDDDDDDDDDDGDDEDDEVGGMI
ncbi:hypothetical protein L249_8427 [Ophiocordyceps polyrhachis-furcata BCC 54312]|uniref:Major facilitator superfamily (MFS) profile domain-containing protein n=1 Tax=Ophiocordyceps polyrhachis-furcata BCC 54312 TaxID=1330021 RepID=A0A367L640_9HYPO|nr:hypothetical protein L249_8427 [Ophiocordyceps polyrhachis-furcata BCC 54312]